MIAVCGLCVFAPISGTINYTFTLSKQTTCSYKEVII